MFVSLLSKTGKFKSISTLRVYASTCVYFSICACVCECYRRRPGFVFQYYEAIKQDLEGSLDIVGGQVDSGFCQDYFEIQKVSCAVVLI